MHDMVLTGICHHAAGCRHFETGCGNAPTSPLPRQKIFRTRYSWEKQAIYANGKITFVACSEWLKELAKSPSPEGMKWGHPNPIDTDPTSRR